MPRAKKAYDRGELESMSRPQLQALAKQQGIKANGTTVSIIEQLLKRDILTQKPAVGAAAAKDIPQLKKRSRNRSRGQPGKKASKEPSPSRHATPHGGTLTVTAPVLSTTPLDGPGNSQHVQSPKAAAKDILEAGAQVGNRRTIELEEPSLSRGATRSAGSPIAVTPVEGPSSVPSDSPQNSQGVHAPVPATSAKPVPHIQAQGNFNFVPMKHTKQDVRKVRQRIAGLIDEQAMVRGEVDDLLMLADQLDEELVDCHAAMHIASWRREAIEQTILVPYKADRHLWDGTSSMPANDKPPWMGYVKVAGEDMPVRLMRSIKVPLERMQDSDSQGDLESLASDDDAARQTGNDEDPYPDMEDIYA